MNCVFWWLLGAQGLWGEFLALCSPHTASTLQPLRMNILARQGDVIAPILQTGSTEDFSRAKVAEMG